MGYQMAGQLSIYQLQQFAPQSPILAFRPEDSGSPTQDWCRHLERNQLRRHELEEFAIVGDVVVRIVDGTEPDPLERVKILSLEYALKVLNDEIDAKEFVRCARAIAAPDASQFEFEQIASYYYGEIRRRSTSEVLKEMGLLGMQLEAVTKTVQERDISTSERNVPEQKLTVADQRRCREIAKNRCPLPIPTPNFDAELAAIVRRAGGSKATRMIYDDFAEFLLDDKGKTIDELDADFLTFEKLEQYDENGIIGFSMSGGQHSQIVYDFEAEVDATYLPIDARPIGREMNLLFVGHRIGGQTAQEERRFILEYDEEQSQIHAERNGYSIPIATLPPAAQFSDLPFTDGEFSEWLSAKLNRLYPNRVVRTARRIKQNRLGQLLEYTTVQEVNPDYEEMQYVTAVCQILWNRQRSDFHLRSLRHKEYQDLYLDLRNTSDTAIVAGLKKEAYGRFKEQKTISLKEFTALNTVAKSQEARLSGLITEVTRKWLSSISKSSANRLRFIKFSLYNDKEVQSLTRQEKQRLWDAVRLRDAAIKESVQQETLPFEVSSQLALNRSQSSSKQFVRVTPHTV